MLEAISFVSKALKKDDTDYNSIHFCKDSVQCFNGLTTISSPIKQKCLEKKVFSVNGAAVGRALEICEGEQELELTKTHLVIKKPAIKFRSKLSIATDYRTMKVKTKKGIELPEDFINTVKFMLPFTAKNSDHKWAEALMVFGKYAYCTNNISVIRTKLKVKLPKCIIPRSLLNLMVSVKTPALRLIITDRTATAFYKDGSWISCPAIAEIAPDISAVFNQFEKPVPISETDLKGLKNALSMSFDGEIVIKKGVISTDTCSVKGTELNDSKMSAENLEDLLKIFSRVKFGDQLSFFKNDSFEAVLAGRA